MNTDPTTTSDHDASDATLWVSTELGQLIGSLRRSNSEEQIACSQFGAALGRNETALALNTDDGQIRQFPCAA
jgi:hypothetical protein